MLWLQKKKTRYNVAKYGRKSIERRKVPRVAMSETLEKWEHWNVFHSSEIDEKKNDFLKIIILKKRTDEF